MTAPSFVPIIRRMLSNLIIHIGTNDTRNSNSREILNKVLSSKSFILENFPDCKIYLSTPVLRTDDRKAILIVKHLTKNILDLNIEVADSRNLDNRGIGSRGLDLNLSGTGRLASNFVKVIKKF